MNESQLVAYRSMVERTKLSIPACQGAIERLKAGPQNKQTQAALASFQGQLRILDEFLREFERIERQASPLPTPSLPYIPE